MSVVVEAPPSRRIKELEAKHPERLRVIHTLTREPDVALCGPFVRKGRVNAELLRELIPRIRAGGSQVARRAERTHQARVVRVERDQKPAAASACS